MNGKWHIVAFAVCIAICTKVFATYAWILCYFLWLLWIFYDGKINQLQFVVTMFFLSVTIVLIPSIENTSTKDLSTDTKDISGKIVQPLDRKEHVIESVMQQQTTNERILLTYFPEDQVQENALHIPHGATCTVNGKVDIATSATNPGEFDYKRYLDTQGISYQLIIESPADISCSGQSPLHYIHLTRDFFISFIDEEIDPYVGSWIRALILGDTDAIDIEIKQLFQRWGLSHILAISGLHVGLIVGLLYIVLVKSGWITKETASYLLMGFIPFYIIIAGASPSVLRAGLMVFLFLVLKMWFRKISTTDGLSIVFIVLVCFDPFIVYHIGFQFSFLTTFSLLLSRKWLSQTTSRMWHIAQISFVAQMAILPLQINAFYVFQPLSILLNLIIVTYFSVIVIPFLFVYVATFPLVGSITKMIDGVFLKIHTLVLAWIQYVDQLSIPSMVIGSISLFSSVIYYLLFIGMMIAVQQKNQLRACIAGCILVGLLTFNQLLPYISKEGTVTMLDIGQGDTFVIELPYRKGVIMVDAGATFSFTDQSVSEKVFDQVIEPYLHSRGIHKVDALIISHNHLDHNGSAPLVMESFDVDHYIVSTLYELNEVEEHSILENDIQLHQLQATDEIHIMDQMFTVLSPDIDYNDENENSLTVLTELGGKYWLFTGDIGKRQEDQIVRTLPNQKIDIWKVAHHGSNTSSSKEAITHYDPEVFLIPVGENNRYDHPEPEVLEVLEAADGVIYRTDEDGAVQYHFKENKGTFIPFLHMILLKNVF